MQSKAQQIAETSHAKVVEANSKVEQNREQFRAEAMAYGEQQRNEVIAQASQEFQAR